MGAGAISGELGENTEQFSGPNYRIFVTRGSPSEESSSHNTSQSTNRNTSTNVNFASASSSSSPRDGFVNPEEPGVMVCNGCLANFTLFKRKKQCLVCSKVFCHQCFGKDIVTKSTFSGLFCVDKHCIRCRVFHAAAVDRNELMMLKVKDLRAYLHERNVQTKACKEKSDLVDLVINGCSRTPSHPQSQQQSASTNQASEQRHQQHQQQQQQQPQHHQQQQQQQQQQQPPPPPSNFSNLHHSNSQSFPHFYQQHSQQPPYFPFFGMRPNFQDYHNRWSTPQMNVPFSQEGSPFTWQFHHQGPSQTQQTSSSSNQNTPQPSKNDKSSLKVEDLETEEAIHSLSVRQLKQILDANFVNYKGCFEKEELLERVKRLWASKKQYKETQKGNSGNNTDDDDSCKICMDAQIECVLLECGHMVTCVECGKKISECPLCRQNILRIVRVFKA